jgi:lipopolysaccharide transport system ATP-binding protein
LQNWIPASTEVIYQDIASAPGNEMVRLRRACVRPVDGSPSDPITVRTPFVVEFEYWKLVAQGTLELSVYVYNEHGTLLFNTWWVGEPTTPAGLLRSWFVVPGDLLNTGTHRIGLVLEVAGGVANLRWDDLLVFDVHDAGDLRGLYHGDLPGAVRPRLEWKTEQLGSLPFRDGSALSAGKAHR